MNHTAGLYQTVRESPPTFAVPQRARLPSYTKSECGLPHLCDSGQISELN
jgi:hypothetical protein